MDLNELIIDSSVLQRTTERGAQEIARALHAQGGDCQTCVRPLGRETTLCVDDTELLSFASLHHLPCRRSGWNDSGRAAFAHRSVTFVLNNWVIDDAFCGLLPMVVLNPSLEQVCIRELDGGWYPCVTQQYLDAGMRSRVAPDGPPPDTHGISARITPRGVIQVTMPSGDVYPDPDGTVAPAQVARLAREQGGVVLAVTHLAASAIDRLGAVNDVMGDPLTVMGRVKLY